MEEQMLGKTMHMTVKWQWDISFIFEQFTALEDEAGWLILGFAITILISMLSVALPAIKGRVIKRLFHKRKIQSLLHQIDEQQEQSIKSDQSISQKQNHSTGELIFHFCYICFYSMMHILTMMLLMTYNGYVIIAVIISLTLSYTAFGFEVDKDKNIPVNCCA